MTDKGLKIINLGRSFETQTHERRQVISGLNLTLNEGDFVSVVGSNGAGKSTLFNLMAGNLLPSEGQIQLNGVDISKKNARQRAKQISRVFQDPNMGTAGEMSVLANLVLAEHRGKRLTLKPYRNRKKTSFYAEKLKRLDLNLEAQMELPINRLSGGQRQAVSLLMATIQRPELLLLDEHTAALDPKTSQLIMALTNQFIQEESLTTLMITHDLKDALQYGNRLIMLHQGKIVLDLNAEEKAKMTVESLLHLFLEKSGSTAIV